MSRCTTEPFLVRCKLLDGRLFSADGLLFLDSILYHAWFAKYAPYVLDGLRYGEPPKFFGLPFRRMQDGRYAASCGFYDQYSVEVEHWVKRPDFANRLDYFDPGAAAKVNTSKGQERAYRHPCIIRSVGDVVFYGYGTIDKVKDLIAYIPSVGKKAAAGWGAVREWTVEPFDMDWSTWSEKHGLMRPMPIDEYDGDDKDRYQKGLCAVKPPAWKSCNQRVCYIPEVANEVSPRTMVNG